MKRCDVCAGSEPCLWIEEVGSLSEESSVVFTSKQEAELHASYLYEDGFESKTQAYCLFWPKYEALEDENALDAARWRQFRGMVSAKSVAKGDPGVFVIPKIDNILGANLLKGNVAEHFDAAMDVNILMENK